MSTCANCAHIKRHQNASMPMYRAGFCGCAKQPAYVYMSRLFERHCTDFAAGRNQEKGVKA